MSGSYWLNTRSSSWRRSERRKEPRSKVPSSSSSFVCEYYLLLTYLCFRCGLVEKKFTDDNNNTKNRGFGNNNRKIFNAETSLLAWYWISRILVVRRWWAHHIGRGRERERETWMSFVIVLLSHLWKFELSFDLGKKRKRGERKNLKHDGSCKWIVCINLDAGHSNLNHLNDWIVEFGSFEFESVDCNSRWSAREKGLTAECLQWIWIQFQWMVWIQI